MPVMPITAWIVVRTIRPVSNTCSVDTTSTGIHTSNSHAAMTTINTRPRAGRRYRDRANIRDVLEGCAPRLTID